LPAGGALSKPVLGPVPVKRGQPLCLYAPNPIVSSAWTVYNSVGQRLSTLSFGSEASQCMNTASLAPGTYFLSLSVNTSAGTSSVWQKVSILP
jgi:hypothetical protein